MVQHDETSRNINWGSVTLEMTMLLPCFACFNRRGARWILLRLPNLFKFCALHLQLLRWIFMLHTTWKYLCHYFCMWVGQCISSKATDTATTKVSEPLFSTISLLFPSEVFYLSYSQLSFSYAELSVILLLSSVYCKLSSTMFVKRSYKPQCLRGPIWASPCRKTCIWAKSYFHF